MTRTVAALVAAGLIFLPRLVFADEGGVSYWIPGQYGSFAAEVPEPGWDVPFSYYHAHASASGSKEFARGGVRAGIVSDGDFLFLYPTYTLHDSLAGARVALSLGWAYGGLRVSSEATLSGPGGGVISANPSDRSSGGSDLYPQISFHWGRGARSAMAYLTGNVPTGFYDPNRMASLGLGHGALDLGGAFTWTDSSGRREASSALGFTANFENPHTHYRNGLDAHLDWAASQALSGPFRAGVAGYFYQQLTGDSGDGAVLGDFKSRVIGLGPEIAGAFELAGRESYAELRTYWEFAAQNRPSGWNLWLSLVVPLGG